MEWEPEGSRNSQVRLGILGEAGPVMELTSMPSFTGELWLLLDTGWQSVLAVRSTYKGSVSAFCSSLQVRGGCGPAALALDVTGAFEDNEEEAGTTGDLA